MARKGRGLAGVQGQVVQAEYAERIAVAWAGGLQRGGVHLVSLYLWTREGLTERNCALLHRLALLLRSIDGPWIDRRG